MISDTDGEGEVIGACMTEGGGEGPGKLGIANGVLCGEGDACGDALVWAGTEVVDGVG